MARTRTQSTKAKTKPKRTAAATKATVSSAPASKRLHEQSFWSGSGWIGGVTLVVLGLLFLAQSYTPFKLGNWWALFLLIPTVGAWSAAYRFYEVDKRVGRRTWGAFVAGLFPALVAIIFLNDLDWAKVWPLFLIIAGFAALSPRDDKHQSR